MLRPSRKPSPTTSLSRPAHAQIEQLIREGKGMAARTKIQRLLAHHLDREGALILASLARRAELPSLGLRLLNPLVRSHRKNPKRATDAEKVEYAACLIRSGGPLEGLAILERLDPKTYPEIFLLRGFAMISHWKYDEAIPNYLAFVKHPGVDSYWRMVGKANLAEACLYERHFLKAWPLLRELLYEASLRKHSLLLGKALELSAQNFILQKRFSEGEKFLSRAHALVRESGSLDEFFVRKWTAILNLMRSPSAATKRNLNEIRKEAFYRNHWESVRACDHLLAVLERDSELFLKVYFGTPYRGFRQRLLKDWPHPIPKTFRWKIGSPGGIAKDIDLTGHQTHTGKGSLRTGQLLHRLLVLLASDFYRPFRIATIHTELYPGEFFNPVTAPTRVHSVIKRLRGWFKASGLPLLIEEEGEFYRLTASGICTLHLTGQVRMEDETLALKRIREHQAEAPFSTPAVSKLLGTSLSSAHRYLQSAWKRGILTREGRGRATRYRFSEASSKE